MFGRPRDELLGAAAAGAIFATAARVPIGPEPPKLTGSGTFTFPGGPDSAT